MYPTATLIVVFQCNFFWLDAYVRIETRWMPWTIAPPLPLCMSLHTVILGICGKIHDLSPMALIFFIIDFLHQKLCRHGIWNILLVLALDSQCRSLCLFQLVLLLWFLCVSTLIFTLRFLQALLRGSIYTVEDFRSKLCYLYMFNYIPFEQPMWKLYELKCWKSNGWYKKKNILVKRIKNKY